MATSGSMSSSSHYGGRYIKLSWSCTHNGSGTVTVSYKFYADGGKVSWYATGPTNLWINGSNVYSKSRFNMKEGTLKSGTFTKTYNGGTATFVGKISTAIWYGSGSVKANSKTFTLPSIYKISFNLGGAPGTAPGVKYNYNGGGITLPAAPTWTGYKFDGWSYNNKDTIWAGGAKINPGANYTYKAYWTAQTMTISYNKGTATSGTVPASHTCTLNVQTTLKTNSGNLARPGYSSDGWKLQSTGGNFAFGGTFTATAVSDKVMVWRCSPINYKITYDENGGGALTDKTYTIETAAFALASPTRAGYTFNNWTLTSTAGNWPAANTTLAAGYSVSGKYGNVTVKANWTANSYKITYDENGGNSISDKTYTIKTAAFTLPTPTRTGYTFNGWKLSSAVGNWAAQTYAGGTSISGKYGNVTLVAQWTANSYTLPLNGNGGTLKNTSISVKFDSSNGIDQTDNIPTRSGYVFLGWFTNASAGVQLWDMYGVVINDGTYWQNGIWKHAGNPTLYAHWATESEFARIYFYNTGQLKAREFIENGTAQYKFEPGAIVTTPEFIETGGTNFTWKKNSLTCGELIEY